MTDSRTPRCPPAPARPERVAFTLIEMLTVLAIMILLMTIAVGAFVDMGRGAKMRTSVRNIKSALVYTRQKAITEHARTFFYYGNIEKPIARGYYFTATNENLSFGLNVMTNFLDENLLFASDVAVLGFKNLPDDRVGFKPDGTCFGVGATPHLIRVQEEAKDAGAAGPVGEIRVQPMTGYAKIAIVDE